MFICVYWQVKMRISKGVKQKTVLLLTRTIRRTFPAFQSVALNIHTVKGWQCAQTRKLMRVKGRYVVDISTQEVKHQFAKVGEIHMIHSQI